MESEVHLSSLANVACGCRIMVITLGCQSKNGGSIPLTRSKIAIVVCCVIIRIWTRQDF